MTNDVAVPHGEDKITVELTVKEAIALTGFRFNQHPELLTEAKKKVKQSVEDKMLRH